MHQSIELINFYSEELSTDFTHQILSLRNLIQKNISDNMSVSDLFKYILNNHASFLSNISDVVIAIKLFLTLPVTVAEGERSFSKLKQIKNYLRSTMSQVRLTGLATLSIEFERARKLNVDNLIDEFANKNAKRSEHFQSNILT